jgi:hypothetical protein
VDAHCRALRVLDPGGRANLLRILQERSLAGRHLTIDEADELARLLVDAELQTPGILLESLNEMVLERLAVMVVRDSASEPFLTGYESWDGSDLRQADPGEDLVVRQYRYLLRTAPLDALEAAHRQALAALQETVRGVVLRTVQAQLLAGQHLGVDDIDPLAHLIAGGERRRPGALTSAMPPAPLRVLAQAVIDSEAAFALFGGYAAWDGTDPQPLEEHDDSAFGQAWHAALESRNRGGSARAYDSFGPGQ